MFDKLSPLIAYGRYWLIKEDKYAIQTPFLYQIYIGIFSFLKERKYKDLEIESYRKSLLSNSNTIEVKDFGAGSKKVNQKHRKVSNITRYSTSGRKFAQLYQYFCTITPNKTILELGTCTGISTRYLASVCEGKLYTFEGSEEIQKIASLGIENPSVHFILGKIEETLPKVIKELDSIDFALIDANHTFSGTMESFELLKPKLRTSSIVAIGDIHWSKEMERAWDKIKKDKSVRLSLDFYEAGILFFSNPGQKEHRVLDY